MTTHSLQNTATTANTSLLGFKVLITLAPVYPQFCCQSYSQHAKIFTSFRIHVKNIALASCHGTNHVLDKFNQPWVQLHQVGDGWALLLTDICRCHGPTHQLQPIMPSPMLDLPLGSTSIVYTLLQLTLLCIQFQTTLKGTYCE